MKIVVFSQFARPIFIVFFAGSEPRTLSRRLAALRFWPSCRTLTNLALV